MGSGHAAWWVRSWKEGESVGVQVEDGHAAKENGGGTKLRLLGLRGMVGDRGKVGHWSSKLGQTGGMCGGAVVLLGGDGERSSGDRVCKGGKSRWG